MVIILLLLLLLLLKVLTLAMENHKLTSTVIKNSTDMMIPIPISKVLPILIPILKFRSITDSTATLISVVLIISTALSIGSSHFQFGTVNRK